MSQISEQLLHTFDLQPPPFEEDRKISTMIEKDQKEHSYKMNMPPCGIGLEKMTRHIHEFSERAGNMEIPVSHGLARFFLFRMSLSNAAPKAGWQEVTKGTDKDPKTAASFKAIGKAWIARVAVPRDRDDQILWMRTVTKGYSMSTEVFDSNLRLTNSLTEWLPGNSPILTEPELKTTFFNGMPQAWKAAYRAAGKNYQEESHTAILAYMRGSERESDLKAKRNVAKQQRNGSLNRSIGGKNNSSSGGQGKNHNGKNRSNNRDQGRNVRPRHEASKIAMSARDDEHHCYEHVDATHKWKECFEHPRFGS
jgi:hypothetical protein